MQRCRFSSRGAASTSPPTPTERSSTSRAACCAGVSPNDGWVEIEGTEPSGAEVEALSDFAASLDADVEWTVGSEESLVRGLENGDLDVVAGGLTDKTPWTTKAGTTRPRAETTLDDGKTVKLVMLVPLGENAFLSRLETFLTEEAQQKGIAP